MARDEAKWTYWSKQIKSWQASGLTRSAYCQREGLKPTTFDYWRPLIACGLAEVKVAKQPVNANDITLVPVKVMALGAEVGLAPGIVKAPLVGERDRVPSAHVAVCISRPRCRQDLSASLELGLPAIVVTLVH